MTCIWYITLPEVLFAHNCSVDCMRMGMGGNGKLGIAHMGIPWEWE